jgi:hypothetical protein
MFLGYFSIFDMFCNFILFFGFSNAFGFYVIL